MSLSDMKLNFWLTTSRNMP